MYRATNRAELDAVTADLPVPAAPTPVPLGHLLAATQFLLFGDLKIGGWAEAEGDLKFSTVFGDTTVILPDGCRCRTQATSLFGDNKIDLAPPLPHPTQVDLHVWKLFGDVRVFSLSRVPEGKLRRLWKALRSG